MSIQNDDRELASPIHSAELEYLNRNWNKIFEFARNDENSLQLSLLTKLKFKFKTKLKVFFWDIFLKDFSIRNEKFFENLVKFSNDSSRYNDSRHKINFWKVIDKLDSDLKGAMSKYDALMVLKNNEIDRLKVKISDLEKKLEDHLNVQNIK